MNPVNRFAVVQIEAALTMHEEDLANLDEWMRRLKTEYHIFFGGHRKKPPDDLKLRVERLIKKLSECTDLTAVQRFRFNTLITRFYVYRDLWRRTLSEKEMGAAPKNEAGAQQQTPARSPAASSTAVCVSLSDPMAEEGKVRQLYDALLRLKKTGAGEPPVSPISYDQFVKFIATRIDAIQEKHGCTSVAFTIDLEDEAIRFTAAADSR